MTVSSIADYRMTIKNDGNFSIATGKSRMEKNWKNKAYSWSQLLKRLETPVRTNETLAEYLAMSKDDQDRIKDVGGFVGGILKQGRRKTETVESRQLITLDADFAPAGLLEDMSLLACYAYAVYSTHKHNPDKPRLRFLIPLDRQVTPDEYEAIARKLAEEIGIDYFDDTTYQPARLMYWPSVAQDGEYIFYQEDLPWLKADSVLTRYQDWTDTSSWPESSRAGEQRVKLAKKQGDPTEKTGLIGAFCRTYDVEDAITAFLSDVYAECSMKGRYTYAEGSTAAGLVIYEDGKFAYSNHSTDPAGGKLCNAFDLVRIHKFGAQDEEVLQDTPTTKLPSYQAMLELVQKDEETSLTIAREQAVQAVEDFTEAEDGEEDDNWKRKLSKNKRGLEASLNNALLVMQHDQNLKGIVFNQMADNLEIRGAVPWKTASRFWRDADDAQIEAYLSRAYTEFPKAKIQTAITKASDDRSYHPVREYLDSLPEWDGIPRVDTLLIDYLGAEDNNYVRSVTRKTLCAAIARIRMPGCKFDTMLVLNGPQGVGKSTLIHKLGGDWFSDSLSLSDTKDKTAAEKLQGYWIIEIGELAGLRKMDVETLKGFLSRQDDKYRASYGRRVSSHPRQCVFIGTTNAEDGFLRDITGGRRFWPVVVPGRGNKKGWDMTEEVVRQIWAEALVLSKEEKLYLDSETEEMAKEAQREALESDPREAMVRDYLNVLLPDDWYSRSKGIRKDYFTFDNDESPVGGDMQRNRVCYPEIWCECFGNAEKSMEAKDRFAIKAILEKMDGWKQNEKRQKVPGYGIQTVYERSE